jgi:dihydrodipicolinate synthase/N-acetylneuraminate lyase
VFPLAIKEALHLLGVCEPWSAPPVRKLEDGLARALHEALVKQELLTPERSRL